MDDIELAVALRELRERIEAQRWMMITLCAGLALEAPVSRDRLLEYLAGAAGMLASEDKPFAAHQIEGVVEHVTAMVSDDLDPVRVMAAMILMRQGAGPGRLEALSEWLTQGTAEEVAGDLEDLLRRLSRRAPPDTGA